MKRTTWCRVAACVLVALVPAAAPGEVVRLKDASTLRGRLVRVEGDTLTFKTPFGSLKFHRSQVVSIVFDDSALVTGAPAPATPAGMVPAGAPGGKGSVEVVFKDRELSSKIEIDKKKQWDEHIAANHVVVQLIVDGRVAHADSDTTMDKRIYKGHTTVFKNDVTLKDLSVDVPSGMHHVKLVVKNAGADAFREDFDPEPLDLVVPFDNLDVRPGEVVRLDVGINRGKLRLGQPKLYRVQ